MHWFLGFPCFEALLASCGGARVEEGALVMGGGAEGDLICAGFGAGEGGEGEGEEEEGLRESGEVHGLV